MRRTNLSAVAPSPVASARACASLRFARSETMSSRPSSDSPKTSVASNRSASLAKNAECRPPTTSSLALPLEFLLRVLPDGFQHPVPVFADHADSMPDQALVEQRLERVDVGFCDRFRRGQRAAAREDGERSEHASLVAVEELVGPAIVASSVRCRSSTSRLRDARSPSLSPRRSWIARVESARTRRRRARSRAEAGRLRRRSRRRARRAESQAARPRRARRRAHGRR